MGCFGRGCLVISALDSIVDDSRILYKDGNNSVPLDKR